MRTVLITGTSTGIGEECARHLAQQDWTVYAGVRRTEDGDRLKTQLADDIRPVILDVTNRDQMRSVIDEISRDVGDAGLQGLVNNAGASVRVALIEPGEVKTAIWDKAETTVDGLDTTLQGVARPRARYLVGPDAKFAGTVVSRAPDRIRDALVAMGARRWEKRGRRLSG